ncbi:uncharacterized protein LACBIDRAFT_333255 [Laccaria bicolor S238N-H82]|uniref:Predicted protein n=1 Tax=Laccaria bicolor (strain S238N-H82 / ATCC MYA-4686) TaxID=486041 RepID=B0DVD9_LACBS|nr:uncharacterized protein LACBIDRAFT_333255 [Laccaria bicolor S238N-H82]EDR01496.1 predicted protein [Laccaria bicolor S238N-H82]|eukprot:XP_001887848.1 predicted protein [Laccaria bicolor S238N-H82]
MALELAEELGAAGAIFKFADADVDGPAIVAVWLTVTWGNDFQLRHCFASDILGWQADVGLLLVEGAFGSAGGRKDVKRKGRGRSMDVCMVSNQAHIQIFTGHRHVLGFTADDLCNLALSALVPGCFIDLSGVCVDCKRKSHAQVALLVHNFQTVIKTGMFLVCDWKVKSRQ